jgi:hypothetical protein
MLVIYLWVVINNAQLGSENYYTSPIRFFTTFFVGVAFYLYRDLIAYNKRLTILSALLIVLLITNTYCARHVLVLWGLFDI